jgi:hypothetical protein
MVQSSDIGVTIRTPDAAVTLDRQLKQSEGGRPARFGGTGMDPPLLPSPQRTAVKNQSYYAIVLTLLVLLSVAVWQFFSLAHGGSLREPYAKGADRYERSTPAATVK